MRKKRKDNVIEAVAGVILLIIAFICYLLFFRYVQGDDIWYDEVFSMGFIREDIRGLAALTAMDVHPPFYYMYLKAAVALICTLSESTGIVQAAKAASLLPWIGLFIMALIPVRKRFGMLTAGLFILLITAMPQIAPYYTEIRMYSLALMLVTFEILLSVKLAEGMIYDGRVSVPVAVVFTIVGLITAYTQYYACIAVIGSYIALTCLILMYAGNKKKSFMALLGCAVVSAIAYMPWLPVLIRQADNISGSYWIQPLTLRSIGGCIKYLTMPVIDVSPVIKYTATGCVILSTLCTIILYLIRREKSSTESSTENEGSSIVIEKNSDRYDIIILLCCLMPIAVVVVSGFILSAMGTPIFVYRYMIPAAGGLWLFVATGAGKVGRSYIRIPFVCVFIAVCLLNMRGYSIEEHKKLDMIAIADENLAKIPKGSVIVTNFDHVTAVIGERMTDEKVVLYDNEIDRLIPMMYANVSDGFTDDDLINLLDAGERVYFFGSFNSREEIISKWSELRIGSELTDSIMVERYWFNIYRLYRID